MNFIYKPLYLICLLFLLDKVFLLSMVQKYTVSWQLFEPEIYRSRNDLFDKMRKDFQVRNKSEQFGVIFGSSRSAWFQNSEIRKIQKNTSTYNFSAPMAGPAWHYYWLEKILSSGIDVSFILLEADALLFTEKSLDYSLAYSFDPVFVFKNVDYTYGGDAGRSGFSLQELEHYLSKYLFVLFKFPLDTAAIKQNFISIESQDNPSQKKFIRGYELKDKYKKMVSDAVANQNGSLGNPYQIPMSAEEIRIDAGNSVLKLGLNDFHASQTQMYFYNKILRLAKANNIALVIFRPPSTREFRQSVEQISAVRNFHENLYQKTGQTKGVLYIDPQKEDLECNSYTDSFHISGHCFPALTELLFSGFNNPAED